MSTGRNVAWIGGAGAVVLGLVAFMVLGSGDGEGSSSRSRPKTGTAAKVRAEPAAQAAPMRSVEERMVVAAPIDRAPAPSGAPNVVLVVLTAARKDQLSPYGAAEGVTPFLARMAGQGARFLDTIADAPHPRSSSSAMLTGVHSWNLGIVEPGEAASRRLVPDDVPLLAERFRGAGWTTLGATGNTNLNQDPAEGEPQGGFGRGFDLQLNAQEKGFAKGRRQEAGFLVTQALKLLEARDADRPFYLQLDFIDTHAPIRVVEEELSDFESDQPNAPYRAALNRVDKQLERLWTEMQTMGLTENTYLVVVADHGEGLGAPTHHGKLHGRLLYESSVSVPWIVVGPGIPANQLVGGLAAGVDLAPTVLELAGLPVEDGLDGMSHAAVLRGQGARTARESTHSATWHFTAKRASSWTSARQCQADFGSLRIEDSFVDACYDRRTDPAFTRVVEDEVAMKALWAWIQEVQERLGDAEPVDDK